MTINEAIRAYLDDQASGDEFDMNEAMVHAEMLVEDAAAEWAEDNGYEFDEDQCQWVKTA